MKMLVFLAAVFTAALQTRLVAQAQPTGTISNDDMKVAAVPARGEG